MGVRATVQNGRLLVDEPTELPEGTVLELAIDDGGDELDEREREAFHAAITKGLEEAREGLVAPAADVLQALRARRAE